MNRNSSGIESSGSLDTFFAFLGGYSFIVILTPIVILCILITLFVVVSKLSRMNDEMLNIRILLEEIVEVDRIKSHSRGDIKEALVARDEKIIEEAEVHKKKYTAVAIVLGCIGAVLIVPGIFLLATSAGWAALLIIVGILTVISAAALITP